MDVKKIRKKREQFRKKFMQHYNSREGVEARSRRNEIAQNIYDEKKKITKEVVELVDDIIEQKEEVPPTISGYEPSLEEIKDQLIIERLRKNAELLKAIEEEYQKEDEQRQQMKESVENTTDAS